jgi:hypothetical protein
MINNKYTKIAITVAMGLGFGTSAFAASSGTQNAGMTVDPISEITFEAIPAINIVAPVAGSQPAPVTVASTWAISTNSTDGTTQILSAKIATAMPTNAIFTMNVSAPVAGSGQGTTPATSAGAVALTNTSQPVVSSITATAESGLAIEYILDAPVTVADGDLSRVVTLTLADAV